MIETTYRGLPEFGLPLIPPDDPTFQARAEEILRASPQFGPRMESVPERAALLENRSARAVITFTSVWRYTDENGGTRTSRFGNLGSGNQMNLLTGREKPIADPFLYFLPGSARLITEERTFSVARAQGMGGGGGFVRTGRPIAAEGAPARVEPAIVKIELEIDIAIFDDGLCVGADENGLREGLIEQMRREKDTGREIVRALREGATRGQIFEMLRPLAQHRSAAPGGGIAQLLSMFARSSIQHLINAPDDRLLDWFEEAANIVPLELRRPA